MFNSSALNTLNYASIAIPDYIEAAHVCAPNTAAQSITANTVTALTLDTLRKTITGVSVGSNQLTLPAGTYTYQISAPIIDNATAARGDRWIALYNVTSGQYETISNSTPSDYYYGGILQAEGQLTINVSSLFEIRVMVAAAAQIRSGGGAVASPTFTSATAALDQRTTIKLWKFKENFNMGTFYAGGSGGGYTSYGEWAWVCAPNTAGQSISANTITTLTIDSEVSDIDNIGSISSNQVTLNAGSYYFEVFIPNSGGATCDIIGSLYNISDSSYVSRKRIANTEPNANVNYCAGGFSLNGTFTIISNKTFEIRFLTNSSVVKVGAEESITDSTAGADQRTTLKVWKK